MGILLALQVTVVSRCALLPQQIRMRHFNLCFLGFGNVGRALARLFLAKTEELRRQYGIEWSLTGVATRRMGWLASPGGLDVTALLAGEPVSSLSQPTDVREWLRAGRADVLFETTSLNPQTGQPAIDYLRAALEAGAHAITANKGPVVHAYRELSQLARARGRRFMFESAALDCLPIFSLFRETLPSARLYGFHGLFNSTTTIILEEIEAGRTFDEGVKKAQVLGVTETDPRYDTDGWDAAVKVCALARVLLNSSIKLEEIEREGISALSVEAVWAARAAGKPLRLVSRAKVADDGRVIASVRPERIAPGDPLGSVGGTSLIIHFELDVLPGLTLAAHHPNNLSTAYGMWADFINAVRD